MFFHVSSCFLNINWEKGIQGKVFKFAYYLQTLQKPSLNSSEPGAMMNRYRLKPRPYPLDSMDVNSKDPD